MATSSWNAGIIRPVAVPPAGPYQDGAAPGVWTLDQQAFWQKQGLWPTAGNVAPIGLFGGRYSDQTNIQKIIIPTTGNATSFGTLSLGRSNLAAVSSDVRAVFAGGTGGYYNTIDYVSFSSGGAATDFGDLTEAQYNVSGTSNYVRGIIGGGSNASFINTINYITISSAGTISAG